MKSLDPFLSLLATIPDPRRAEGKIYALPHVLLFSIFAIVSGANSYRGIRTYVKVHRQKLNKAFKIKWKRPPAHTAIRYILQGLSALDVEKVFREHAANLNLAPAGPEGRVIAFDGKTLKASFDNFNDTKAKQVLSAFAVDTALGASPYRNRRKIQRDPRGAEAVGGTRRSRTHRHLRRHALPKKPSQPTASCGDRNGFGLI